jgi:hypothetical protein
MALKEATLTATYPPVDGFQVRWEFRRDSSNQPFFLTRDPGVLKREQQHGDPRPAVVVRRKAGLLVISTVPEIPIDVPGWIIAVQLAKILIASGTDDRQELVENRNPTTPSRSRLGNCLQTRMRFF